MSCCSLPSNHGEGAEEKTLNSRNQSESRSWNHWRLTRMICCGVLGRSPGNLSHRSMACTTSMPSMTSPKTAWLPSSHGVGTVVKKNWEPPVLRPAFAIENIPGLSCLRRRAEGSQGIFQPGPPVPALRAIGSAECGQPP